ncbi:PHP domain-containing protein [bacterium]|nr:PHP domain-containing protein [bacterium]
MRKKIIFLFVIVILLLTSFPFLYSFLPKDVEYKKALLKSSGHNEYTLENMKSIIGEQELTYVLKKYDKHPEKFMTDINEKNDQKGVENLTYRAGLHSHTTFSDGSLTPEETLNQAAEYADKVKAKHPFERYPMIIAITDHFNTQGCIEAIDVIQKNPEKYKNLKFVIGMETEAYVQMPSQKEEKQIHILAWCINPYEWPFKDLEFHEPWNNWGQEYKNLVFLSDYKEFIKRIYSLKYGLTSIAHPLRYFEKDDTIDNVINELFDEYKTLKTNKEIFTEGYYQPYRFDIDEELYKRTAQAANERGIYRTGSQDTHGMSVFSYK